MAGHAKDPNRLDRDRERTAVDIFRYVAVVDAVAVRLVRHAAGFAIVVAALILTYGLWVADGFWSGTRDSGTIAAPSLDAFVTIARDVRDVPHIVASSERDAFYAQGFAEATDRLFQMELTRRYALGTLAEVLGPRALAIDEEQRAYGVAGIAAGQWRRMDARDRADLQAFADGVNAGMTQQPLPVEFRLLLYRPRPWTVTDSLAVALAVSIALGDSYHDVLERNDVWRRYGAQAFAARYPLSDPKYDVSLSGIAEGGARPSTTLADARFAQDDKALANKRPRIGSNAWAVGAVRAAGGRALLANDPHLELTIPGLWYVVDLRAPGIHAAGAAIPGAPGVALGHNERVAWGATNADVASTSVYAAGTLARSGWHSERFAVRFGSTVTRAYYRSGEFFGANDPYEANRLVLVRCAHLYGISPIATFLALDRARSAGEATSVLARYSGPAENFVLADTSGAVAYHLAGTVVDDAAWGRYVHAVRDRAVPLARISYAQLPSTASRRDAAIVSANNKMYRAGYPYRLASFFDPPYRAYRIAELLHERKRYDVAYFEKMQLDEISPIDREFARRLSDFAVQNGQHELSDKLRAWDGSFSSSSRLATIVHSVRTGAQDNAPSFYAALESLRSGDSGSNLGVDLTGELYYAGSVKESWGRAGAVSVEHPLAPLHFGFLNGATFPGAGDEYTIRLQEPGFAQSFRAVWDV
ncbi:MAG TPA: penicillin acylase family protein, partial [Candidatus Baltobacteraceae bacterium]|nr:penicillin acylase family protein [Candidatus Baltobacteraceae bacterium]